MERSAVETTLNLRSCDLVREAMSFYQTPYLKVDPREFEETLRRYLNGQIAVPNPDLGPREKPHRAMHGFWWGHNHDFGSFRLEGVMGDRHVWVLGRFLDYFGIQPADFSGRDVIDIGCWTGGVSLAMHRWGGRVTAIDEIRQYPHMLDYMARAFGLGNFVARGESLYDLNQPIYRGQFDIAALFGVIYHLSDMLVGLRRVYQALRDGGLLLLETYSFDSAQPVCLYSGAARQRREGKGWDYFIPSPPAIEAMLEDCGFDQIAVGNGPQAGHVTPATDPLGANRCLATARKVAGHEMYPAGLSITDWR